MKNAQGEDVPELGRTFTDPKQSLDIGLKISPKSGGRRFRLTITDNHGMIEGVDIVRDGRRETQPFTRR